jgi:hypothetical protein
MRWEKSKKGISKKRRAFSFLLKKETQWRFGSCLTKCRFIQIICRATKYFLSRGLNTVRRSVPAQKIRGLLESSLNEGQNFQPRAFVEFPVGQEIAQVGWAMPSNREAFDGNVVSLIIG